MNIIKEYRVMEDCADEFHVRQTDKIRTRKVFTYLPMWLNKFSWFQNIILEERLYFYKYQEFNYYNYQFYWTKWKRKWKIEKIL